MKTTPEDIEHALGAFLMCLGRAMPPQTTANIKQLSYELDEKVDAGGEPNVARLTRVFAQALNGDHLPPATR